jgi:hypothetical protein
MELGQLIEQLEDAGARWLPAHHPHAGGCRCPRLHLGRSHAVQDHRDAPAISFTVSTAKFEGQVTILYDRGGDTYVVELHRDGELVDRHDEVYFDMLGEVLERLIDDGAGADRRERDRRQGNQAALRLTAAYRRLAP